MSLQKKRGGEFGSLSTTLMLCIWTLQKPAATFQHEGKVRSPTQSTGQMVLPPLCELQANNSLEIRPPGSFEFFWATLGTAMLKLQRDILPGFLDLLGKDGPYLLTLLNQILHKDLRSTRINMCSSWRQGQAASYHPVYQSVGFIQSASLVKLHSSEGPLAGTGDPYCLSHSSRFLL